MPSNTHIKNLLKSEKFTRKRNAKLRLLNVKSSNETHAQTVKPELPYQNYQYANGQTFQLALGGEHKKLANVAEHVKKFIPTTTRGCDDPTAIYHEEKCYNQFLDQSRKSLIPLTFYACSNPYNATTVNDINPVIDVLKADCLVPAVLTSESDLSLVIGLGIGIPFGVLILGYSAIEFYFYLKDKFFATQVVPAPHQNAAPVNQNLNMP